MMRESAEDRNRNRCLQTETTSDTKAASGSMSIVRHSHPLRIPGPLSLLVMTETRLVGASAKSARSTCLLATQPPPRVVLRFIICEWALWSYANWLTNKLQVIESQFLERELENLVPLAR